VTEVCTGTDIMCRIVCVDCRRRSQPRGSRPTHRCTLTSTLAART